MKLTDLHSSRIEALVEKALRSYVSHHECNCDDCEEARNDEDGEGELILFEAVEVKAVAKEILMELAKLEAALVPA